MVFESYIFSLFGPYDKAVDINKDINDEGTNERFQQCIGWDLDTNIMPLIDNLLPNIYDADACLPRYVPYLESFLGMNQGRDNLYLSHGIINRRAMLKNIAALHRIKGTSRVYEVLFGWMGLNVVITESFNDYGFDSPVTLDDDVRVFDTRCSQCSPYTIALTGSSGPTPAVVAAITSIVVFNNPINAQLASLTLNGSPITIVIPPLN